MLQRRFKRWLDRRIPAQAKIELSHSSIFIFPSRFGLLFLLTCACLFLLGSNYQNNLMLLMSYFLLAFFLVNLIASYRNFAKLHFKQGKLMPVYAGEHASIPVWIEYADKQAPQGKLHANLWQDGRRVSIDLTQLTNPLNLALECPQRGCLDLPRITLSSYYPFGLYRCWTHIAFSAKQWVFPAPLPGPLTLEHSTSKHNEQQPQTGTAAGRDEFDRLRAYQVGEPLHHVAWKEVAKGRELHTKLFHGHQQQQYWLDYQRFSGDHEERLSRLSFWVQELHKQQQAFGLQLPHQQLALGSGWQHQEQCLQALAKAP